MLKMPNCDRQKYSHAIVNQGHSRWFLTYISPVVVTALCLYTTSLTRAQELPTSNIPAPNVKPEVSTIPGAWGIIYGNQISLNGRTVAGAWLQRPGNADQPTIYISDGVLRQLIGVDLLNTNNPVEQPIDWFSPSNTPISLNAWLQRGYRYLEITNLVQTAGWQIQANGNILVISTPSANVREISQTRENFGERLTVNLDRPAPWQVRQELPVKSPQDPDTPTAKPSKIPNRIWKITIDGIADPALIQKYTPIPPVPLPAPLPAPVPNLLKQLLPAPEPLIQQVEVVNNQTVISLSIPFGMSPRITTVANPNRLIVDVRPDALVAKDITWARGLRWRQQIVNLGKERFPVVWLEINPRAFGLTLKPIRSNPNAVEGTAPLMQIAPRYSAAAAINAGYFNRNNRLPLGAIRQNGQWISGPILNRGAIAWNDAGEFYFDRLTLQETLTTANNLRSPILFLNSAYIQTGIARYTSLWGQFYTPLSDNEIILTVQKEQVITQLPGGKAGQTSFPIPPDGYLLVFRGNAVNTAAQLPIGTALNITSTTISSEFSRYPNIIGAGPLLIKNRQIVLDAKAEKFSDAFITEKAIRSGICTNSTGQLMITATHNRAGGPGPTLAEHAQLMQLLGCVDALNLDGGSSTSLYLGGQLLDRSPNTAARVHNGIGIFLEQK
ncbi:MULTISPECIES: phosphodiester glycosidase family protein [Calothrix]|uniref:Phosphodiester glycosidase family protein n=2 Tax=Calothrix TaxID=1186 RepID=A0ABR8A7X4_9CYAN|nr:MULTISPECIES: phosphodiester glycosidase family protein [Calothrix]MBD2196100.1 phosphodiester glycosidase family protein [Calothrix parietina FACHB-288]MBD2224750.1 phosphodiester glycosidase family protein [Calothrix anomala FACHB-343]